MSAGKDDPIAKLPRAGDRCDGCKKFWTDQGEQPKYMVHVFDEEGGIMTTEGGIEIVICPHCDGDFILKLSKHIKED